MKILLFALAAFALPFSVFAHEGHGHTEGFTITHFFVESEHALYAWPLLLIIVFFMVYVIKRTAVAGK